MRSLIIPIAASVWLAAPASAQTILKEEPAQGALRYPETVLVESRRCPAGHVMEVTGGRMPSRDSRSTDAARSRSRRCVPR